MSGGGFLRMDHPKPGMKEKWIWTFRKSYGIFRYGIPCHTSTLPCYGSGIIFSLWKR